MTATDMVQVGLRVNATQFARADQAVDDGGAIAAGVRAKAPGVRIVVASNSSIANCPAVSVAVKEVVA